MSDKKRPSHASDPASTAGLVSWALYDWANSAFVTVVQTFVFAAYFTRQVAATETAGSAWWGYTIGAAGLAVALAGPILGATLDHSGRRKPWIAGFTLICTIGTALLWFVEPAPTYMTVAVPAIWISVTAYELSAMIYNAVLPQIAPPDRVGRWSGWGWGLGYAGGLTCLVLCLVFLVRPDPAWFGLQRDSAQHIRATFLLVAVWYGLFALPMFLFTPDTPSTGRSLSEAFRAGLGQLRDSIRNVRHYASLLRFLIARMVYVDGLATLFAFGGVYASGTFQMNEEKVLLFGIALNVTAGLGALAFSWVDDWIGGKRTILISLTGVILPGTVMLFTASPVVFWACGLLLGIFVGPIQAASRSYLARTAPSDLRNQMFGLYTFSGKATAFVGPFCVGWLTHLSGSQRVGMTTIIVFLTAGFLMMLFIPNDKTSSRVPADG